MGGLNLSTASTGTGLICTNTTKSGKNLDLESGITWSDMDNSKVQYCDEETRKRYIVLPTMVEVDGKKRLELRGVRDDFHNGKIIFVVDMDWTMYVGEKVKGKFHHTSFLAGSPVQVAGMLELDTGGLVKKLTPHSGHYEPGLEEVKAFVEHLIELNVETTTF